MIILLNILWFFVSIFMILVVLVQRGRGGGLAGALGGAGGSSAFGTKAGDVFTKITVGVFIVWLLLGLMLVPLMSTKTRFDTDAPDDTTLVAPSDATSPQGEGGTAPTAPGTDTPAGDAKSPAVPGDAPATTEGDKKADDEPL